MANPTISDGLGGDLDVAAKTLSNGADVQQVELVTAVEAGASTPIGATNRLPTDGEWVTDLESDTWDSATATAAMSDNSLSQPGTLVLATQGAGMAVFWMRKVGSVTGGRLYFECSANNGDTWVPASATNGYWVQYYVDLDGSNYWNGGEAGWRMPCRGFTHVRIRHDTVIAGTGDVIVQAVGTAGDGVPFTLARLLSRVALGSIDADTESVVLSLEGVQSQPAFTIFGTYTGTLAFQGLIDGTWLSLPTYFSSQADGTFPNQLVISVTGTGNGTTNCGHFVMLIPAGCQSVRVLATAWTSGTANIVMGVNGTSAGFSMSLIAGDKGHDGADLQSPPVKVGLRAVSFGSNPTGVGAADRSNWYGTRSGQAFVLGGHPNVITIEANYTAAQTDTAIVSVSAGTKIVVTQCQVLVSNATTTSPQCRVGFGTANTPTTTGVVATHPGISPGGGVSCGDGSGIIGVGADAEDLRVTCDAPTSGVLRVLVKYFTIEG